MCTAALRSSKPCWRPSAASTASGRPSPGEFTRRAFLNRKMDLAEVEGLADLIDAQTRAQHRQALRQVDGALGRWVGEQRGVLLDALAAAESAIDFADEGDVVGDFAREVATAIERLAAAIDDELGRAGAAARVRDGLVVTIAGPPNAGKSTLLNALARREAAIVSPHAGTTRDPVEVQLDLGGQLVRVIDTAGLRATDDPIEREGIARARARAQEADLVLWVWEAGATTPPDAALPLDRLWIVATKIDRGVPEPGADHAISALTGEGMPSLVAALQGVAGRDGGEPGVVTRLRHRRALEQARALLGPMRGGTPLALEIAAERLRQVEVSLANLVGRIPTEEVLGAIFARFCIGK